LAEAGEIDVVIMLKIDRLARTTLAALLAFETLEELGVSLVFVEESIDTSTPAGRLMRDILAAFAAHERATIVERMGSARYRKALRGEWPGSAIPFGYRLAEDSKSFEVDEAEARLVRRAYALRLSGLAMPAVAKQLTAEGFTTRERKDGKRGWKSSNLTRLIRQPVYKGEGVTLKVRRDPHDAKSVEPFHWEAPALVSAEDFDKATATKLAKAPKNVGQRTRLYAFSGRMYHRHADGTIHSMFGASRTAGTKGDRTERELHCTKGRTNAETGEAATCEGFGVTYGKITRTAKADRVEADGLGQMLDLIQDPAKLKALQAAHDAERAGLDFDADKEAVQDRIKALSKRRDFLVDQGALDAEAGRLDRDAYKAKLAEIDEALTAAETELARILGQEAEVDAIAKTIDDILSGPVYGVNAEHPVMAPGDEMRLSREWFGLLRDEIAEATTPGPRGSAQGTLSPFALTEAQWLAGALNARLVLARNEGEGPQGAPGARWPMVSIELDPYLNGGTPIAVNGHVHRNENA
jgi:DNA invertase Pin-like site-specific DNA recombinase